MNLTEVEGSNKYIHREFAADSYPDMDDWVRALQEVHMCVLSVRALDMIFV